MYLPTQITDVCVMDDGEFGFGVYYRVSISTEQFDTWYMFGMGYARAGAVAQAGSLLGQRFDNLNGYPGEGVGCGSYFGAWNAPFVYRKAL